MSKVSITKAKLDYLANCVSSKSGESIPLSIDAMADAVLGIETGGGSPTLQTKSVSYTPSTTAVSDTITADNGYDGLEEVDVTVSAVPMATIANTNVSQILSSGYDFDSGTGTFFSWAEVEDGIQPITQAGYISTGTYISIYGSTEESEYQLSTQGATAITPTESQQTAVSAGKYTTGAVTVNAIPSNYVGSGITQRSSSDLTASGATVTVPSGYYSAQASKAVSSGSASPASTISATGASVSTGTNTLTLSKTVSNTPTVSAGYVSSGTAGNSSVSLTASVTTQAAQTIYPSTSDQTINSGRYLTGNQTIKAVTTSNLTAENIKSGVTVTVGDSADADRVASVTGTYTGGGGSISVASTTWTNSSTSTVTHQFTGLSGTPKFAVLRCTSSMARSSSSTNYHIADMVWNGTSCVGNSFRRSNGTYANVTSGYTASVSGSSITFTSSGTATTNPGSYYNGTYELIYVY